LGALGALNGALVSEPEAKYQRRKRAGRAGEACVNSKWPKLMLMGGITSSWLLYEMATATEARSRALAILQYGLLGGAMIGLVGSLVMLASEK
jgi:hypothetical protein